MALNRANAAGRLLLAMAKPTGMRTRPKAAEKAGKLPRPGRTANLMIAAQTTLPRGAERERDCTAVGQIALRRQQQNQNRNEHHHRGTVWPGGDDPEKLDHTNCDERAPGADESRKPVGPASAQRRLADGGLSGASTSSASPSSARKMPASTLAASSATSRRIGVSVGNASNLPAASSHARAAVKGFAIQRPAEPGCLRRSEFRRNGFEG